MFMFTTSDNCLLREVWLCVMTGELRKMIWLLTFGLIARTSGEGGATRIDSSENVRSCGVVGLGVWAVVLSSELRVVGCLALSGLSSGGDISPTSSLTICRGNSDQAGLLGGFGKLRTMSVVLKDAANL